MRRQLDGNDYATAVLIALALFVIYNANGREIPSYDSQPTKFASRELLLRGSLSLNYVVGGTPQFIERAGFQLARDGHYRSAYSPTPAVAAAAIIWPFEKAGMIDILEPRAPNLISALTSSMMVATAVALMFLTARRWLTAGRALAIAAALGLGTGLWSTASQTLWQHETSILGLSVAVFGLSAIRRPGDADDTRGDAPLRRVVLGLCIGLGLGLAAGSRQQLLPAVAVLTASTLAIGGWRCAVPSAVMTGALLVPVWLANLRWFGSVLGAAPMLEAIHSTVHATSGTFSLSSGGFAGLLLSPNRGLLVYSPVIALVAAGIPAALRPVAGSLVPWCTAALITQFLLYGSYVVWWGGHTYGPRYMLDLIPLLVPLAILAMARMRGRLLPVIASAALAWSVGVAGLGAFVFPHERWNTLPIDVDRHHERLWDWSDTQIRRSLMAGMSPQNYSLVPVIVDEDEAR